MRAKVLFTATSSCECFPIYACMAVGCSVGEPLIGETPVWRIAVSAKRPVPPKGLYIQAKVEHVRRLFFRIFFGFIS